MYIIWDTNIYVRDFHLSGTQSQLFLAGFKHLQDAGFGLPEVVRVELLQKYREAVEAHLSKAQTSTRRLADLASGWDAAPPELDVDEVVDAYDHGVSLALATTGFEVLPVPHVDGPEALRRAVRKTPPFDSKGRGFRDYLIWLTVLGVLKSLGEPVVLVSENKADFGDGVLKPELAQDVEALGFGPEAVQLFNSLEAFNSIHVRPLLDEVDAFQQAIQSGPVREALDTHLANDLPDRVPGDMLLRALGFPPDIGDAELDSIWNVGELQAEDVYLVESSSYLAYAVATVEGHVRLSFSETDYTRSVEVREFLEFEPVAGSVSLVFPRKLTIGFVILIETDSGYFSDPEVGEVNEV